MSLRYRPGPRLGKRSVVHMAFAPRGARWRRPGRAVGIIAIGDVAMGVIAIGPVAFGLAHVTAVFI